MNIIYEYTNPTPTWADSNRDSRCSVDREIYKRRIISFRKLFPLFPSSTCWRWLNTVAAGCCCAAARFYKYRRAPVSIYRDAAQLCVYIQRELIYAFLLIAFLSARLWILVNHHYTPTLTVDIPVAVIKFWLEMERVSHQRRYDSASSQCESINVLAVFAGNVISSGNMTHETGLV